MSSRDYHLHIHGYYFIYKFKISCTFIVQYCTYTLCIGSAGVIGATLTCRSSVPNSQSYAKHNGHHKHNSIAWHSLPEDEEEDHRCISKSTHYYKECPWDLGGHPAHHYTADTDAQSPHKL